MTEELLHLDVLRKTFPVRTGVGRTETAVAVDGVTLSVARG